MSSSLSLQREQQQLHTREGIDVTSITINDESKERIFEMIKERVVVMKAKKLENRERTLP